MVLEETVIASVDPDTVTANAWTNIPHQNWPHPHLTETVLSVCFLEVYGN